MFSLDGYFPLLLKGVQLTIMVGICSMCIAVILGMLCAWGKLSHSIVARKLMSVYTTVFRGVPELVMILLLYYGIPTAIQDFSASMGYEILIDFNPFIAGVFTLGMIYGAFTTEVFRGAYLAVPPGQMEAAKTMGMSNMLMARRIIIPQMMRYALPGLGNVWMVLIKATALISVIQLPELMRNADIAYKNTKEPFTWFFIASLIYLLITLVSLMGQKRLEAYANRGVRRV